MGKSYAESIDEAQVVIFATLSNPVRNDAAKPGELAESTDAKILQVLKSDPAIAGKKEIKLCRFVADAKQPVDYLVFAEIVDGKIDPYRGMPIDDKGLIEYLAKAHQKVKGSAKEKLGFFFSELNSANPDISSDAYKEFARAPYNEVKEAATAFDPDLIVRWLQDKSAPSYKIGLYGCLLGVSGKSQHAAVLKQMLESDAGRPLTGVDGLLGGYCTLEPEKGPAFVYSILNNPKNDFNYRYAALRSVRFIINEMHVKPEAVLKHLEPSLEIADITDLVIDEFRKNQFWQFADKITSLYGKEKFDLQVIKRSITRYALRCPASSAKALVEKIRKDDAQFVADVEEILKFEETQLNPLANGK